MPSLIEIGPPVKEKKIFEGFYHIWAWRPFWFCDLNYLYTHWLPHHIDASNKICLYLAKRFRRRRCLNIMETYNYVYYPGVGAYEPLWSFFQNH